MGAGACAVTGIWTLLSLLHDGPEEGDPAAWVYSLTVLSVALAVVAIVARRRLRYAMPALLGSLLCLAACWVLVILFSG